MSDRHFTFTKTGDATVYVFQSNKMGSPENDAIMAAMRKLHRTNKNIEVHVYHGTREQNYDTLIGWACWDCGGHAKKFIRK